MIAVQSDPIFHALSVLLTKGVLTQKGVPPRGAQKKGGGDNEVPTAIQVAHPSSRDCKAPFVFFVYMDLEISRSWAYR